MTHYPQQLPPHFADDSIDQQTGSLENGISPLPISDVARPPVPPRLKPHNEEARNRWNVTASDSPPLVPRRAPVVCQPVGTSRRPALEPRLKAETQLAGIHSHSKPLLQRSRPVPSTLPLLEAAPELLVISKIVLPAPAPQLNSRIILEGGCPTTVIDEADLDAEGPRSSPVVRLSLWPIRSPSSNLRLDAFSNLPKRTNDYVDGPTLGPTATSQADHELTSFALQGPRMTSVQGIAAQTRHSQDKTSKSAEVRTKSGSLLKHENACKEGVICSSCGRCRCRKCVERRELPRRWISQQECSIESAVDWCTCMCVARAVFYHCRPSEDADCSDDPCGGCDQPHCCARWAAVGLLSLCLPCLCCYWPMSCLRHACTACYNACCRTQGCRCERDLRLGSKGLLTESESSSF